MSADNSTGIDLINEEKGLENTHNTHQKQESQI